MIATLRRGLIVAAVCLLPVLALAPTSASAANPARNDNDRNNNNNNNDWRVRLKEELPLLGHRNWIAVVDSAYPTANQRGHRNGRKPAPINSKS